MPPLYDMQDTESGVVDEIYFPMADAPEIGTVRDIEGRKMRRIIQPDSVQRGIVNDTFIEALSLPKMQRTREGWKPPADEPWYPKDQKCNAKGVPVFESARKRDEFLAHSEGRYGYGID